MSQQRVSLHDISTLISTSGLVVLGTIFGKGRPFSCKHDWSVSAYAPRAGNTHVFVFLVEARHVAEYVDALEYG